MVSALGMFEPGSLRLQDFIKLPLRESSTGKSSDWRKGARAEAWWQARINDLPGRLGRTVLPGGGSPVEFNLRLDDPIEKFLPRECGWRGTSGDYVVRLPQPQTG